MKTFKVTLVRTTLDYCDVEVEAEDEWDARDKAMDFVYEGDCDWRDEYVDGVYPKEPVELEQDDPRADPHYGE